MLFRFRADHMSVYTNFIGGLIYLDAHGCDHNSVYRDMTFQDQFFSVPS